MATVPLTLPILLKVSPDWLWGCRIQVAFAEQS